MGRRHQCVWWLLALGLWLLCGCAKTQLAVLAPTDWTASASGAYVTDEGRVFYGIGRASGLRSAMLLRATADNQAQTEMAGVIRGYLARLSAAAGMDATAPQDRQALHDLAQAVLRHARIVDHSDLSDAGAAMSLCRLDLDAVRQVLRSDVILENALQQRMLAETERVHDAMVGRH